MPDNACKVTPGCAGHVVDGFCDTCGMQPPEDAAAQQAAAQATAAQATDGSQRTSATGSQPSQPGLLGSQKTSSQTSSRTGSTQLSGTSSRSSRRTTSTRSSSRRRLGLGIIAVPELPKADPLTSLMKEAKVPEAKRFCTGARPDGNVCESPLTKEKCTKCGHAHDYTGTLRKSCSKCGAACELVAREKGFCNICGTPYDFKPKLAAGDTVAGQYEVAGCIAYGGMGWIYLAKDTTLGRYVLLKGLLNSSDPSLAKAAVAERQFLAELKHPNIVSVYTCVSDTRTIDGKTATHAYTVMEFIGGQTLKALRKDRGPLPVAEALAYMHPVLTAFGYMHDSQLVYNDFKPDNVMLEQGDIKVIDLGGVCRLTQSDVDIYSTVGYAAPELGGAGPSPASDLYSIGRTLAVLCTEFKGYQGPFKHALRSPADEPVFAKHESLYKLLQKACHENPNMRFQDAEEMAEQLVGVLREVVSLDTGQPHAHDSAVFGPDTLGARDVAQAAEHVAGYVPVDAESLPALKLRTDDPAATFIVASVSAGADPRRQYPVLVRAVERFGKSVEARLALARNRQRVDEHDAAELHLAEVEKLDPYEWRVIWLRGLALVQQKQYAAAVDAFETCDREMPGELAPKLAIGVAAELAGDHVRAIASYDTVSRTDPSYATAVFGLARCRAVTGERDAAVEALGRIPQTSSLYAQAQKTLAATLLRTTPRPPGVGELSKASATLDALTLKGLELFNSMRDVFSVALQLLANGAIQPAKTTLMGHNLDETDIRRGLEHAYRNLARLATDRDERVAYIDRANQVRPRTWT